MNNKHLATLTATTIAVAAILFLLPDPSPTTSTNISDVQRTGVEEAQSNEPDATETSSNYNQTIQSARAKGFTDSAGSWLVDP